MPKPFITFAVTRFVERPAVIESLRECARTLKERIPSAEVCLFGSYAAGTPTPRSDADIAIIIPDDHPFSHGVVKEAAETAFLAAPVPAEVFVLSRSAFEEGRKQGRGLAGAVAKNGLSL